MPGSVREWAIQDADLMSLCEYWELINVRLVLDSEIATY